ncbi:hypothetical protein GTP55_25570 [Duganella sp. FT109W]|uniref:Uncharacterized protein n=1 Tax=Duganella margarita TaxID=2692170 RepID=A0ABW9WNH0_9BURK|nr:hypothetical protein [Duganella margarita]MYN42718.1 hypothetical protein [Duganella margarita]
MTPADKSEFGQLLAETLAAYGKPLPEATMVKAWLANLAPFPMSVVRAAMQAYRDQNGEFAPVPAGIAMRCKLLDGRPGAEEAWAIALRSQDEADTVVWTAECAAAFALASPILALGDEVGARMAFKEAYVRMVAAARADCVPATWSVSIGWDGARRDAAISRAVVAGQLPAPAAQVMLGGPAGGEADTDAARAQLAKVRQLLADGAAMRDARREAAFDARVAAEDAERLARAQQVAEYAMQHGLNLPKASAASPGARHAANGIAALPADTSLQKNRPGRL